MFSFKVRRIFWTKIWLFLKVGVFQFLPHRHISAVFELWPTKFWCHVALPECFPKVLKYVDQSSSVSIKWGFFRFLNPYRGFARKCALFSPRDAPDFWCLMLKLPYSTRSRWVCYYLEGNILERHGICGHDMTRSLSRQWASQCACQ